jgi:two-component system sensor histidine kinase/response regulator
LQRPGAPNLLHTVIQSYLTTTPQLLQTLSDAVTRGDSFTIQDAAHSLKSSSANVGATSLAALSKELEIMGQGDTLINAAQVLAAVETAYNAVRDALTLERDRRDQ